MPTIKELEERIKKLEEKVLMQDEIIKKTLDFVQHAIDDQFEKRRAYYKQKKEEENRFLKESEERKKSIEAKMKELGWKLKH